MKKILFVCLGNICRSSTAEGVLRHMAEAQGVDLEVDSAGTGGYHVGDPPDPRPVEAAQRRGYDLSVLRARQVNARDFGYYDLILAMDYSNLENLRRICPAGSEDKLDMFLGFAENFDEAEVPDPYYGAGGSGFERVLDMCEDGCRGLLAHLRRDGA